MATSYLRLHGEMSANNFYQEKVEIALAKKVSKLSKLAHLCIKGEDNEFLLLHKILCASR